MKLIIAIINNDDREAVLSALTQEGFTATRLSTTGGFIMAGNTTLLIGAEDEQVAAVKNIIEQHSSTRTLSVTTDSSLGRGLSAADVKVTTKVKGATVFVLSVDRFEKI